jgi:hypothetical protein
MWPFKKDKDEPVVAYEDYRSEVYLEDYLHDRAEDQLFHKKVVHLKGQEDTATLLKMAQEEMGGGNEPQ